jgi:ankyrin repeat protein
MFEELEQKFANIQNKIELKQHSINDSFQHEIKTLYENYNEKNLLEKYSNELNLYRDGVLKKIPTNLRLEIEQANVETKQIKNFKFKRGLAKSERMCIGRLVKKEFKLKKIFQIFQLVKFKNYLGLEEVIQTVDESNDEKILFEAMFVASQSGQLEKVRCLVDYGADLNAKDEDDETALILASKCGHLGIVKYLVETGADLNAEGKYGWTALNYASRRGHLEMVKYLVANEANVNSMHDNGWTALMYASEHGHLEIVKYLVEHGANVNAKYENQWTALMYASRRGHLEIVKYLVENGAHVNFKYDNASMSVLILASENGHLDVVKYLVEKGANFNSKDKTEALVIASEYGHFEIVKYLVENGNEFNLEDKKKALMYASEFGHIEIVKHFAERGAIVNANNYPNKTALTIYSEQGNSKIVTLLNEQSVVKSNDENSEVSTIVK